MAINWPDSPVDGTEHVEEGTTWVYQDPPGCWQVGSRSGGLQTIVESNYPDGPSWQVVGDMLIQHGWQPDGPNPITITLPQAYKAGAYSIGYSSGTLDRVFQHTNLTATGFTVTMRNTSGGNSSTGFYWMTIGEAPDNLKKPKEVINPGPVEVTKTGDGYLYTGDKLIQWGTVNGQDVPVVFPKEFQSTPSITVAEAQVGDAGNNQRNCTADFITATGFTARCFNSSGNPASREMAWMAIGDAKPEEALPTTVMGNAVSEYHDPATVAPTKNWRLIGRTLEVWGTNEVLTSGTGVTMPMPFASDKWSVSLASRSSDATADATAIINDASTMTLYSTTDNRTVTWHAIGEVG